MRVAICAATFRRPAMLAELLRGVGALELGQFSHATIGVVIVDNDAGETARPIIDSVRGAVPFPVHYIVEPRRGIAHARNAAIAAALADGADFVALIDDDEVPNVDWLCQLLRAQAAYGADALYGPVSSRFAERPAAWVIRGGFFDRPVVPTGQAVPIGATGNVLLSRRLLERRLPPFDVRFGLTGGEDTHFFLGLKSHGIPVISCAEAVVVETVPPDRTSVGYVLRRAYAAGASYVAAERCYNAGRRWAVRRAAVALIRIVQGTGSAAVRWPLGMHHAVRGLQMLALGAGMLAGLRGSEFEHYRTTQGA